MRGGLSPSWRCYCHIIIKRRSMGIFLERERDIHREGERGEEREQRLAYIKFG